MCTDRMGAGSLPACVEACPVQAIQIEAVNVAEWRRAIDTANAPGVPPADLTLSTTRITQPLNLPPDFGKHGAQKLEPEPAHWSLVYFLTVGQASVGAALGALALSAAGVSALAGWLSVVSAAVCHMALAGTLFHLGRPLHAWKAMRAYKRSWLSREVIAFSAYAGLAPIVATDFLARRFLDMALLPEVLRTPVLAVTAVSGLVGVYTSVRIYRIPARPAWDSARTTFGFFNSSFVLGSAFTLFAALLVPHATLVAHAAALVFGVSMLGSALVPWALAAEGTSSEPSLRSAAQLLKQSFRPLLLVRTLLSVGLALAAVFVAAAKPSPTIMATCAAIAGLALLLECAGRYLFFRCVVPRNMPQSFFSQKPAH
jgi:DMSO reductase anchor subunit